MTMWLENDTLVEQVRRMAQGPGLARIADLDHARVIAHDANRFASAPPAPRSTIPIDARQANAAAAA